MADVTLNVSDITPDVITNLYLYGQVAPPAYQDILSSSTATHQVKA